MASAADHGERLWEALASSRKGDAKAAEGADGVAADALRSAASSVCVFVGDARVGKSTLLLRLKGKEEKAKPSVALEYQYAKRKGAVADVSHLWELAGGNHARQLLSVPISPAKVRNLSVVLVVDLSDPTGAVASVERWVPVVKAHIDRAVKGATPLAVDHLRSKSQSAMPFDHPDRRSVRVSQVPITIVGNKYDAFANEDPIRRKTLAMALRFLAHSHGASLVFTSGAAPREDAATQSFRQMVAKDIFHVGVRRGAERNPERPLFVPFGADAFEDIRQCLPSTVNAAQVFDGSGARGDAAQAWLAAVEEAFGPQRAHDSGEAKAEEKESAEEFREALVDEAKGRKDKELQAYRKDVERRERLREAEARGAGRSRRRERAAGDKEERRKERSDRK